MGYDGKVVRGFLICALIGLVTACAAPGAQAPEPANPQMAVALAEQGRQALEQGQTLAARRAWQKAVTLDPSAALVVNNLALLLVEDREFPQAATLLARGIQHSPNTAELHYNLAVVAELYLLDLDRALRHYQRYRDLSGKDDAKVAGWITDLERRLN